MKKTKVISLAERVEDEAKNYLEKLLSEWARKMLQAAIENEMTEYLEKNRDRRTQDGQRAVVRSGYHTERELVNAIGPIKIEQPRVRHRDGQKFSSAILPPYLRRVPSIDARISGTAITCESAYKTEPASPLRVGRKRCFDFPTALQDMTVIS